MESVAPRAFLVTAPFCFKHAVIVLSQPARNSVANLDGAVWLELQKGEVDTRLNSFLGLHIGKEAFELHWNGGVVCDCEENASVVFANAFAFCFSSGDGGVCVPELEEWLAVFWVLVRVVVSEMALLILVYRPVYVEKDRLFDFRTVLLLGGGGNLATAGCSYQASVPTAKKAKMLKVQMKTMIVFILAVV